MLDTATRQELLQLSRKVTPAALAAAYLREATADTNSVTALATAKTRGLERARKLAQQAAASQTDRTVFKTADIDLLPKSKETA